MGTHRLAPPQQGIRGFSLIESLISALLVMIFVIGLLQFTGQALLCYQINEDASTETFDLWNKARDLRRSASVSGDTLIPIAGARPLYRFTLTDSTGRQWEVLCAEK
jgi:Tfp pilus assembly protein PilV